MLRSTQIATVVIAALLFCSNAKSAAQPELEASHGNVACERPDTSQPAAARWHLRVAGNGTAYLELQPPPPAVQATEHAIDLSRYTEKLTQFLERRTPGYSISF